MGRVIRFRQLKAKVNLSRTTIWRMEQAGNFPKRLALSDNSVGWLEHDVDNWIAERTAKANIEGQNGN